MLGGPLSLKTPREFSNPILAQSHNDTPICKAAVVLTITVANSKEVLQLGAQSILGNRIVDAVVVAL